MHIAAIINHLIPYITNLGVFGYAVAALAALLETIIVIGLFIPGSTIVLIFGALSAAGYYNFWYLMIATIIAAAIGDYINYTLGTKYGRLLFIKEKWFLKKSYLKKGKRFFDTYGARSLFFGRLIPSLKETFPFIAGSMNTKLSKYLLWDTLGAIAWGFEFLLAGYLFGSSVNLARAWLGRITVFIAIILLIFILLYAFKLFITKYGSDMLQFQKSVWQYIKTNPDILKFTHRYPKFFGFLNARLTQKRFSGLTLTVLTIVFAYILLSFLNTLLQIINKGTLFKFDLMFSSLIAHFRDIGIIKLMLFITMFGNREIILILSLSAVILFILYKKKRCIIPFLSSTIGASITTWIIKYAVGRPRPYEAYYHAGGFSFPSGHATIAIGFYGFIAYVLIKTVKNTKLKFNILITVLMITLFIGISRIYLDVHYFSDVWAGYLVGLLWLVISIGICEFFNFKKPREDIISLSRQVRFSSYFLVGVAFLLCIMVAIRFNPRPAKPRPYKIAGAGSIQLIFRNNYLRYTTTILGDKQEPINIILIAKNNRELMKDIRLAGWYFADKLSLKSIEKTISALIYDKSYNKAPISPDFWDYKVNSFGIEKLVKNEGIKLRHHGRIWKTRYSIDGERVYVLSVSFDTRLKWIIHKISPDIDKEREIFFRDLYANHLVAKYKKIKLVKPFSGYNFYGDRFFTDGKAYIVWLK